MYHQNYNRNATNSVKITTSSVQKISEILSSKFMFTSGPNSSSALQIVIRIGTFSKASRTIPTSPT